MKILVLLALMASTARAGTCVDRDKAIALHDAAKKAAGAAYDKALAAKKLKPAGLRTVMLPSSDRRYLPADYKLYVVKEVDTTDGKLRVLTDARGSCSGPSAELVQQGSKIFLVERRPRVHKKNVETCDCTYFNEGGCGLAASAQPVGHVLGDLTYAGKVIVEYDVDEVAPTHAGLCPPPQPVP